MSWEESAACRGKPLALFFPDNPDSTKAKRLCAGCIVRAQCLDTALKDHLSGIWGGTTDNDRKRIEARYVRSKALDRHVGAM